MLKLDRVESIESPTEVSARGVLWLRGVQRDGELFESQVHLRTHLRDRGEGWRIRHQELLGGVTVAGDGTGFQDVAEQVGLDFTAGLNPIFETDEWRLERFGIAKYASAGASAVDYDDDGWYDVFLADGERFRLYRNEGGSGTLSFRDVTAEAGLPELTGVQVGLFADFDNDGDRDLFLGLISAGGRLFRNEGDGTFTDVSDAVDFGKEFMTVAAAGDYDGDGDLDLYVGRYLDPRVDLPTTLFYTRNGQGNALFRNDGGLRFTDVTDETGTREGGLTLGVSFTDFDQDGDADLHVANDFGRNALLRNVEGSFVDASQETGTLDFGYGMSSSWGDVDNDGDLDLYVSNVHSGQRWYGQAPTLYRYLLTSLKQGTVWDDLPLYREVLGYAGSSWKDYGDKVVKGNSLLLNDGGVFADVSEIAGTNPFGWYWGSTFLDYDNDGRLDIYGANGWIYTDEFRGELSWNGYEHSNLLRNEGCAEDGIPRFVDVGLAVGADDQKDARGVAVADYDNDGDLDIAVNHNPGDTGIAERARATLLRNDIGQRRGWLAVELEGVESNRDAVGALVTLESGDLSQIRQVSAGSSYASQQSLRLYFGLGDATGVDRLSVRWPSGRVDEFAGLEGQRLVRIREGGEIEVARLPGELAAEDG